MVRSVRQLNLFRECPRVTFRAVVVYIVHPELFHIVGNDIVGYAGDTTIYAVIARPLTRPQVMESLNQDLATINSWCFK